MPTKLCDLCAERGLEIVCCVQGQGPAPDGFTAQHRHWLVTLTVDQRAMFTDFYSTSIPEEARVISCLLSELTTGEMSFADYCDEFGCDPDSRQSERVWDLCRQAAPKLRWFLGDDFDLFATAALDY